VTVALIIFWVCLAVCFYIYFGYPALLFALSRLRRRVVSHGGTVPAASIVIAVYNEEAVIQQKIENALSLEHAGELEVIIASDGSNDRTVDIVRRFGDRVRVLELERAGKAFALNAAALAARGDVLVFTDANVLLDSEALSHLLEPFSDPAVGGVCGNKKFRIRSGGDTTEMGENLYVRYDQWQKKLESEIGSVFAADGMLYAVRKSLFVPIADPAQADDIAISTRVVLQGSRLLYEPRAIAWEEAPAEGREEFRRKIRVTNHSVRALLNLGSRLWTSGFYSVELLSHKLIRHFIALFLIPLFVSNAVLATQSRFFALMLLLQVVFYLLAVSGAMLRGTPAGRLKLLSIPYYFCLVNAAAFLGLLSILRKERLKAWTPRGGLEKKGD
jgi:cellulose synthase/poly-beta-1,6-N-acetylglucosamine synthase-like glycosyltransferase